MQPLAIRASGMVTAVGLDAPSSCAAIRCAIDNFTETRFMDKGGEWIMGAQVPLERPWSGITRLVKLVAPAIRECLATEDVPPPREMPLLLCVAEKERPGRLGGLDQELLQKVQAELQMEFHPHSGVIARGRVSAAIALGAARELMDRDQVQQCIVAGVDSFLMAPTLTRLEEESRLLTSKNSNGFIPGEAGGAILAGKAGPSGCAHLICQGIALAQEEATIHSEKPLRADGLVGAIKGAFADAQKDYHDVDYRLSDANGEQYWFKEAALAMTRTMRTLKDQFEIWHPADCVGEIGAAAGPCALGFALHAAAKGYSPGPGVLCQFSSDQTDRAVMICRGVNPENPG